MDEELGKYVAQLNDAFQAVIERRNTWKTVGKAVADQLEAFAKTANGDQEKSTTFRLKVRTDGSLTNLPQIDVTLGICPTGLVLKNGHEFAQVIERGATLSFCSHITGKIEVIHVAGVLEWPHETTREKLSRIGLYEPEELNDPRFLFALFKGWLESVAARHWTLAKE